MKKIIEGRDNIDFIITYYHAASQEQVKGDTVYPTNKVDSVHFSYPVNADKSNFIQVNLRPADILELAKRINALKRSKPKGIPLEEWFQ